MATARRRTSPATGRHPAGTRAAARRGSSSAGGATATRGYAPAMGDAAGGAGVRLLKFRGGMGKLGVTRIIGTYRMGNMLALLDSRVRDVGPDKAVGGTAWDSYSWHTDLPPGHPMVLGDQTSAWGLFAAENANLIVVWGMNWITTKMPDSHWLTEARLKGTKVV